MTTYLIRRSVQTVLFVLLVWLVAYTGLVLVMPGSLTGYHIYATRVQIYKLDQPWPANFFLWLFDPRDTTQQDYHFNTVPKGIDVGIGSFRLKGSGALTGDFGDSVAVAPGSRVSDLVSNGLNNTVTLVGVSVLVAVTLAVPLGVAAAARNRSIVDHGITFASLAGFSIPPYTLGILLSVILAVIPYQLHTQSGWTWLPYLPVAGLYDIDREGSLINRIYHLVLPVATLALPQTAWLSRHVRSSMLEILKLDYIRTAWAKGLPTRRILFKHAFRNALIPFITSVGLVVPVLISGALMVEVVFSYNGAGQLFYKAVGACLAPPEMYEEACKYHRNTYDTPVLLSLTLLMAAVVAISNMLADILYVVADPRIDPNKKVRA